MAEYFKNNRHRFAHYAARTRDNLKLEMIEAYGGCCVGCGNDDWEVLSLDHIHDDAYTEKEEFGVSARGGHKHYGRLKAAGWPKDRFQLLCYNCNAKKEYARRRRGIFERWGEPIDEDRSTARSRDGLHANNTSGIKGVFWNSQKSRWHAKVMFQGKNINCGFFTDIRDAAAAYALKAQELWGEAANVATPAEIQAAYEVTQLALVTDKTADELGL